MLNFLERWLDVKKINSLKQNQPSEEVLLGMQKKDESGNCLRFSSSCDMADESHSYIVQAELVQDDTQERKQMISQISLLSTGDEQKLKLPLRKGVL
jgi:hypothetical protein